MCVMGCVCVCVGGVYRSGRPVIQSMIMLRNASRTCRRPPPPAAARRRFRARAGARESVREGATRVRCGVRVCVCTCVRVHACVRVRACVV